MRIASKGSRLRIAKAGESATPHIQSRPLGTPFSRMAAHKPAAQRGGHAHAHGAATSAD